MKGLLTVVLVAATAFAQQPPPIESPLLDKLVGEWVLEGTVGKQSTTHEVDAGWVLDHHYVLFHEVSREKNAKGEPQYEASVYITYDDKAKQYKCEWLDVYGGIGAEAVGAAAAKENELAFVFKDDKGAADFSNDWVYDPKTDTWLQTLDNVVNGEHKPFARFEMSRRRAAAR